MIYRILIVYFVLFTLKIFSQTIILSSENGVSLKYTQKPEPYVERLENNSKIIDYFEALDESKPGYPKLPSKIYYLSIPPNSTISLTIQDKFESKIDNVIIDKNPRVELENDSILVYKNIDFSPELFNVENYPTNQIEIAGYTWIRDFYVAAIRVNPYQYHFSQRSLTILDSCLINISFENFNNDYLRNSSKLSVYDEMLRDVILNFEQGLNFRSYNPFLSVNDPTGNWIDYSKEYLKLAIPSDNIYRISYNDLVSYGLNPDVINPKTFKLFHKGIERPIFVQGEDDNVFNQNDFIEFFAERNYTYQDYRNIVNIGQDYIQYWNRYSDTTIVWLTWDGAFGKRVQLISNPPVQTPDTISTHLASIHLEQDLRLWYYDPTVPRVQLPFWQEHKTLTWLFVGNSGSQSVSFSARDFVPNSSVNVIARLISYASNGNINAHRNGLSLNSTTPQDTITYNYKQTVNFSRTYNSSQLISGNNTIRIFGIPSQASFHQSLVDWVDIEYLRRNVAINDTLRIIIPSNVQSGLRVIRIENITDVNNLLIYKTKPNFKKIINYTAVGTNPAVIFFMDTVSSGEQFYITKVSKVNKPILRNKKFFVNLRNPSRAADYILVSNKILQNSSNQYKNFISNNYNVRTELTFVDDIFDEFSYGFPEAEAIRAFLMTAYQNWTLPRPSFVTFLGDANYDYKDVITPAPNPRKKNLTVSYGNPVSDPWYVMWDTANVHFPQMYVGRIPVNTDQQLIFYLQKHQKYLQKRFDIFNKSFVIFSGGDATKPSELNQIIAANDFIMNTYFKSHPLYANSIHFYKTINPPSNFGPYSLAYVKSVIDEGAIAIPYIGHSGTRTWDNSITEVEHLQNKYNDRNPLITDFGCSTGKFAEPDVDAFGELFVAQSSNGQAIIYLGNSSWGYLSTSLRFPRLFYEILTQDSLKGIGRAHALAKIRQLNETGTGDVNRVFTYCNLLLGDPIIGLKIPEKPNLAIDETKIKLLTEQPNDLIDSLNFRIVIQNLGIVNSDSLSLIIKDEFQDSTVFTITRTIPFTKLSDTLFFSIPVANYIGNRKLIVILDPNNLINEIYEDDNQAELNYVINSTKLNSIETSTFFNTYKESLDILNPFIKPLNSPERFVLELSRFKDFTQSIKYYKDFDTLFSKIQLSNIILDQRYYYRMKLDDLNSFWSQTRSFIQKLPQYHFFVDSNEDEIKNFTYHKTKFDTSTNSWMLNSENINLKILSGGGHDGAFGSIQYNGLEQLPNTYYWGLATAIIDSITLRPTFIRYFNVPDPGVADSLTNYVNRQPPGTLMAMTISADAAQGVLGWSGGTPPRNAIKTLGSRFIDSIVYREGWCILGRKGAAIGTVPEDYKKLFAGVAQVEVSKNITYDSGYVVFPEMKFAKRWNYVKFNTELPANSSIIYIPLGKRKNGQVDTLFNLSTSQDSIVLSSIDAKVYPTIRIIAKLYANQLKQSPKIYSFGASYEPSPELAINYQTVDTDKDTIWQGGKVTFNSKIYNVGKSTADTVKVLLELIRNDNSSRTLIDTVFYNLAQNNFVQLSYEYLNSIYDGYGNFNFKLNVDPTDIEEEFFESNNIFLKSFYVKRDTTTSVSNASVIIRFDDKEIYDGDYVEPNAKVNITVNYPIWFPVSDTSAIRLFINGNRVYAEELNFSYDTIERKINLSYDAQFQVGENNLRIFIKDVYGRLSNQPILERFFKVTQDVELLNVYNYPNPFENGTHFTFFVTQIPDEVIIKIYTISGRMIKELKVPQSSLTINFNKVYWDGKDEDGDLLANGVYLYKIIMKKGTKTQTNIQKLAILK